MLKFYRDFNNHVVGVYQRESKLVLFIQLKADGLKRFAMSSGEFARKWTHPIDVDSRAALLTWYSRALTKTRNDPRALQLIGELLMDKNLNEMTMEEVVEAHNELATKLNKPTVDTFKSLAAARSAYTKLTKAKTKEPAVTKEPKELDPNSPRGPVQGVGAFAKALILEGGTNKDVHAAVMEQFPTAKTSVACIAYYRSKLVLAGLLPKKAKAASQETEETEAA